MSKGQAVLPYVLAAIFLAVMIPILYQLAIVPTTQTTRIPNETVAIASGAGQLDNIDIVVNSDVFMNTTAIFTRVVSFNVTHATGEVETNCSDGNYLMTYHYYPSSYMTDATNRVMMGIIVTLLLLAFIYTLATQIM